MTAEAQETDVGTAAADDELVTADEAARQFRAGAPHLLASSANVLGETSVSGDVVAGDKIVKIYPLTELARPLVSGPVPAGYRAELTRRFAEPRDYGVLLSRLRAERILVLRGPADSGRRMVSLSMLANVLTERDPLVVLDPAVTPDRLVDVLQPGTGHLVADLTTTAESPLRQLHLHAARRFLEESDGYLVITMDHHAALDDSLDELCTVQSIPPVEILTAHLSAVAEPSAWAAAVELPETQAYLSADPAPAEIAGFAQILLIHLGGGLTADELTAYGADAAERLARRLFADAGCSLRDKAFLIALAVFDQSPYPVIAEAGDALYLAFQHQEDPVRPAGLSIFGTDRSARLARARAVEYDEEVTGGPARLTGFRYRSTWPILLRHVWSEHPAAREPIIGWLLELGNTTRQQRHVRAAVAAGCLAAVDFATVRDRLLVPWAGSDLLRRRQLAAWALSTAVDQGAEASVRGLLRDWADGSVAKRWTTTRTVSVLADLLGRSAIGLIHTIARQPAQDERLARELVQTVADLLTGPVALQTLGTLTNWATAGNPCRPLAFRAFLRAADRRESSRAASRPILLRLAASNRAAWAYHSELWRTMLNDTKDNKDARQCLARWVVLAGGDQDLETQLGRLFSGLARSPNESARLDHLLRYLPATAPATALPVAERLRERLPVPSIADL